MEFVTIVENMRAICLKNIKSKNFQMCTLRIGFIYSHCAPLRIRYFFSSFLLFYVYMQSIGLLRA